jgi:hypothetical protein
LQTVTALKKTFCESSPALAKKNKRLCGRLCEHTQKEARELIGVST